jgi:hypothetical protein
MNNRIKPSLALGEANKYKDRFVRVFFRQKSGPAEFLGFKIDSVEENKLIVRFTDGKRKNYTGNAGQFVTDEGYGLFLDSVA